MATLKQITQGYSSCLNVCQHDLKKKKYLQNILKEILKPLSILFDLVNDFYSSNFYSLKGDSTNTFGRSSISCPWSIRLSKTPFYETLTVATFILKQTNFLFLNSYKLNMYLGAFFEKYKLNKTSS